LIECRGDVSDGWKLDQERIGRMHLLPKLGEMRLSEIRSRDIGNLIETVKATGRAAATVRHVYNLLHKLFDDAVEHFEFLEFSPVIRRYCPPVPKRMRNFLHPVECTRLMAQIRGHFIEPAVLLGLYVGMRIGEIQALKWESVNLDKGVILIRSNYDRKMNRINPYPKQHDWGESTIPKPLNEFLSQLSLGKQQDDFVATGEQGRMLNYYVFSQALKQLCRVANVKVITPHELRHSCTELWVYNGASKEDCGRQLNHANSQTTERYMHRTNDRLQAIGDSFSLPNEYRQIGNDRCTLRLLK